MKSSWIRHPKIRMEEIKQALDSKVDPNNFVTDPGTHPSNITTPLVDAIEMFDFHWELVQLLVNKGADVNYCKEKKKDRIRQHQYGDPASTKRPLVLALYSYTHHRLNLVKLLLAHHATVWWKEPTGFSTALTHFYQGLSGQLSSRIKENLSILVELLKKGAGTLPQLFLEYDKLALRQDYRPLYCRYAHLAVFGYYFVLKIGEMRISPASEILPNYLASDIAKIIINYLGNFSEYLDHALTRLLEWIETNDLKNDWRSSRLGQKPSALAYPDYPLSLAAYTHFSDIQPLIESKADVTFSDDLGFTPLDYAVRRNPNMEKDDVGDSDFKNPENRFERVKIITDGLRDCYRVTLLAEAQRQAEKVESSVVSSSLPMHGPE